MGMKGASYWFRRVRSLRPRGKTIALLAGVTLIIASFQNCGKVNLVTAMESPMQPVVSLSDVTIKVTMNQKKTTSLMTGLTNAKMSLDADKETLSQTTEGGVVTIDSAAGTISIDPIRGFRGEVPVVVYVTGGPVTNVQHITFDVENPVLTVKPALAVRAPECILCHASVSGDFISDFGYKSSTETGPDLFLAAPQGVGISAYGIDHPDHASALLSANIMGSLIVPQVTLATISATPDNRTDRGRIWYPTPFAQLTASDVTLKDYINNYGKPTNSGFTGVRETSGVYIGAPTKAEILAAAQLESGKVTRFYKNKSTDPDIGGFSHVQEGSFDYWTNDANSTMVCEGDLFVDGVVFLNQLNLQTTEGCRIYSTHTVFINGPVKYKNVRALSNLQVTSALGVYMGFGNCFDCRNANANTAGQNHHYEAKNTIAARWAEVNEIPSFRTMSRDDLLAANIADFAKVSNTMTAVPAVPAGTDPNTFYASYAQSNELRILDGTNTMIGQDDTSYSRVMLNAPVVMSRYGGDFHGTVIAEFAMWKLEGFTFTFDTVFTGVPLFPFLDFTKIFSVQTGP